jgi:hypothetical protein
MKRSFILAAVALASPLAAQAAMSPGLFEYTIKMNMPGAPSMPTQSMQQCLTAKDVAGNKAFEMPANKDSDCQIKDLTQSGGQFSYKMACTKPQKLEGSAKGSHSATGMTMDMTMTMAGMPGPMTQSITARRVGDCK